jgi:hypothetical protein
VSLLCLWYYLCFNAMSLFCCIGNIYITTWPHQWCHGLHAELKCGRWWVRAPVRPNQRLWKWNLLRLRYACHLAFILVKGLLLHRVKLVKRIHIAKNVITWCAWRISDIVFIRLEVKTLESYIIKQESGYHLRLPMSEGD